MEQILYRRYATQSQTMPGRKTRPRRPFKQKGRQKLRAATVAMQAFQRMHAIGNAALLRLPSGLASNSPRYRKWTSSVSGSGLLPYPSRTGPLFPSPQSRPPAKRRYAKSDKGMIPAALMHTPRAAGNRPPASPARVCSPIHRGQAACSLRRNQGHRRSGGMPAL